jgi:hypothetical protein
VASFNYRLLGFKNPPTDFYPRPLLLAAREILNPDYRHCYGSKKVHEIHFDIARQFYQQYPKKKKFLFHFTGNKIVTPPKGCFCLDWYV